MFGKFDSPNKKNENGKHQNPTTTWVFSGLQRDPNGNTTALRWSPKRPLYVGLEVEFTGRYLQAQLSEPPKRKSSQLDDLWSRNETKRTFGPQWKFWFTATKTSKKWQLQASNKNNFHKISMNKLLVTKSDWVCSRGTRLKSLDKDSPQPSSACLENVPFPTSAWGPSAGTMPAPAKSS